MSTSLRRFLLFGGLNLFAKNLENLSGQKKLMKGIAFGVCDLTLPARARDPCTFPMASQRGFDAFSNGREMSQHWALDHNAEQWDDLLQVKWLWAAAVTESCDIVSKWEKVEEPLKFSGNRLIGADQLSARNTRFIYSLIALSTRGLESVLKRSACQIDLPKRRASQGLAV